MMESTETEISLKIPTNNKINPNEFDVAVSAMIIGLGGEKYLDIFRTQNIGQLTLIELSDEDLIKFGIDDQDIRTKILEEVKNLPLYQNIQACQSQPLGPLEIVDVLEESSQHLYRIYLSMLANTLTIKKTNKVADCFLYKDKCASDLALATLSEMTTILNSMDIALHTKFKVGPCARSAQVATTILLANPAVKQQCLHSCVSAWRVRQLVKLLAHKSLTKESNNTKKKKMIVGTVGSIAIVVLAVLFAQSIKHLKQ